MSPIAIQRRYPGQYELTSFFSSTANWIIIVIQHYADLFHKFNLFLVIPRELIARGTGGELGINFWK